LTQTAGRAARNVNGIVIMYADKITESMQRTIDETERRRAKQLAFNSMHNITPRTVTKSTEEIFKQTSVLDVRKKAPQPYVEDDVIQVAADPVIEMMTKPQLEKAIAEAKKKMLAAAKDMDFLEAARLRDEMFSLQQLMEQKFG
jgi:excinuclease ABC subunit B